MSIEAQIRAGIANWLTANGHAISEGEIQLQPTKKEFKGNHTFVVFPFLKSLKMAPPVLAEKIGEVLHGELEMVEGYNVVQGFLNIELSAGQWLQDLKALVQGEELKKNGEKVLVEYSSPNTNKPLHLGHLRNNFLGYSVSQVLKEAGNEVTMVNLVNDRGIHICKSMIAYQENGQGETPESSGLKGDHLVGKYYVLFDQLYREEIKTLIEEGKTEDEAKKSAPIFTRAQAMLRDWEAGDKKVVALWKQMNSWVYEGFDASYKKIGVSFDKYYYESDTYLLGKDIVEEGLNSGVFFKKEDGSSWCDLTNEGLDEKLVLRGDGTAVYMTQDMGTADLKYKDFGADKSIYVVGNEQDYHFKVLQLISSKMERSYAPGIFHLSYGMVDLPEGKMKSREGTVVDADDLIDEMIDTARSRTEELGKIDEFTQEEANELYGQLALGALKYFILKVDPKKRMLFNPKESIDFQGNTGPFIQYTHARISSILRKMKADGVSSNINGISEADLADEEIEVVGLLKDASKRIEESARSYAPSIIASYVYDLARSFNRLYQNLPIFKDVEGEVQQIRLAICELTAQEIKRSLSLLGIDAPERM